MVAGHTQSTGTSSPRCAHGGERRARLRHPIGVAAVVHERGRPRVDVRHRLDGGAHAVDDLVDPPLVACGWDRAGRRSALPASGWPPAVPISKAASACASASAAPRVDGERRASLGGKPGVEGLPQLRRESFASRRRSARRRGCRPIRAARRRDGAAALHASSLLPSSSASAASSAVSASRSASVNGSLMARSWSGEHLRQAASGRRAAARSRPPRARARGAARGAACRRARPRAGRARARAAGCRPSPSAALASS